MEIFWKAAALVLLSMILALFLGQEQKGFAGMLTMAACCMALGAALVYLEPTVDFLKELGGLAQLSDDLMEVLFKCVGVALVCELVGMLCRDAGFGSLAQSLQILSSAGILFLSQPVFRAFIKLLQELLGGL